VFNEAETRGGHFGNIVAKEARQMPERRIVTIHAKTYQEPLGLLAATMVEKVFREGPRHIAGPAYVSEDIVTMLRYAMSVYNLLNYLNADVRRNNDSDWFVRYGVTGMSMVRSLIDCLYNVTAILEDPATIGRKYRMSGLKTTLDDIENERTRHQGEDDWESYYKERRAPVDLLIRMSNFTLDEVMQVKKRDLWPTFGKYIDRRQPGGVLTENQEFLKTFARLEWRQYSALSHGAFEAFIGTLLGDVPIGAYYVNDFLPWDRRDQVDESFFLFMSTHLGRAATVLLCLVTELQLHCRFDGANINERICGIWDALVPFPATKELYDKRHVKLMQEKGIMRSTE
jgi:hypothetical protein